MPSAGAGIVARPASAITMRRSTKCCAARPTRCPVQVRHDRTRTGDVEAPSPPGAHAAGHPTAAGRLELGVLYYRWSYEVARTYRGRPRLARVDAEVRGGRAVHGGVAEAAKSSRCREVFGGFRYQSNANLGPANSSVAFRPGRQLNSRRSARRTGFVSSECCAILRSRHQDGR